VYTWKRTCAPAAATTAHTVPPSDNAVNVIEATPFASVVVVALN